MMDRIRFLWVWVLDAMRGVFARLSLPRFGWPQFGSRIGPMVTAAGRGLARAADRMRRSFVALVSSPAVWMAVIAVFIGSFVLGYGSGANGKRDLRNAVAATDAARMAANERADALSAALEKARAEVDLLKQKAEAGAAEKARREAASAETSKPRPRVRRAARPAPTPAPKAPAVPAWNPFKW